MLVRVAFFAALVSYAAAGSIPASAATVPLASTVEAFAEGGGQHTPPVCGIKFTGMTRDLYAIAGSISFIAQSADGPLYVVAKISKVQIVQGVAKKIAAGAIAADGTPLTEGWRTLADETSLLLASNDPAQVSRAIERLHAGTVLVAHLAEGGVSDSYNLGAIDARSESALQDCLRPFIASLKTAQAVTEATGSAAALGLERSEIQRRLQALPLASRREMAQKLVDLATQMTLIRDLESGACTRAAEVQTQAKEGDPQSLYLLSSMYRSGWCLAKDEGRFHAYLEWAAAQGSAAAAFDLATYAERGTEGYGVDYAAAERWYGRALQAGDRRAMIMLGDMWIGGRGKRDPAAGVRLLEQAAESGDDPEIVHGALDMLGLYYVQGKMLPRNLEKARSYGLRAAAECDPLGMMIVAMSYDAPGSLIQAYAWADAAVRHADAARQYVATGTRDSYKKKLDAAGLAAAEAMIPSLPICLAPKQRAAIKN